MVRFSEIQQFLELFPENFRTICPRFENFEIFGRMVSAHVYTDTEKFRPSLPSQCFNPGSPRAVHLISRETCLSGGNPFAGRFIPRVANVSLE